MKRTRMKRTKKKSVDRDQQKIKDIIDSLSTDWLPEERETSILFDYHEKRVYLETSYPYTARRWFDNLWGDPKVKWDSHADTLKFSVPWEYCRQADLILKKKFREFET